MRNIKILGLAFVTMFSMSAMTAVSASADTLTAQGYPAVLTGSQQGGPKDTLTTTIGIFKCAGSYSATITGPVTTAGSLVVTPTYPEGGCAFEIFPASVDTNGCTYVLKVLAGTAGDFDIECPMGKELTLTWRSGATPKCVFHIPSQTDIGGTVKYTSGSGQIGLEANLTGIDYTHTPGSGLGACSSASATNGKFSMTAAFGADTEDAKMTTSLLLSS